MIEYRSKLFGIDVDAIGMEVAVKEILRWLEESPGPCRYVVTPNVNHIVKLDSSQAFRRAYKDASMVLADGRPIVWASRILGRPLPGVVPGSDLVPRLFDRVVAEGRSASVYLLGAAPGVASRASQMIQTLWPGIHVVGTLSPPFGFEHTPQETAKILADIAAAKPDILIIGLGAPKQERWIHQNRHRVEAKVALCVGATIDFLAGEKPRAPMWMRESGLEWLHRVTSEPKRLSGRYAHDALVFPGLLAREMVSTRGATNGLRSKHSPASVPFESRYPFGSRPDPVVKSTTAEQSTQMTRRVEVQMIQLMNRVDASLGSGATRLLQFLGTASGAQAADAALAYANASAQIRRRRVLLISAEDRGVELGMLDCMRLGIPLQRGLRPVSDMLSYAALRGAREPDRTTQAMIAASDFWARLRDGFDEVIVCSHTPHASQFGLLVASNVDAVMIMVDTERTPVSRVREILADLRAVKANVLGTVMSQRRSFRPATDRASRGASLLADGRL